MIQFLIQKNTVLFEGYETLVYPIFEGDLTYLHREFLSDPFIATLIQHFLAEQIITGKKSEITHLPFKTSHHSKHLILLGLGKHQAGKSIDALRQVSGKLPRFIRKIGVQKACLKFSNDLLKMWDESSILSVLVEGMVLGDYKFEQFKKDAKEHKQLEIILLNNNNSKITQKDIDAANDLANFMNKARDLANMPPNHLSPALFKKIIEKDLKAFPDVNYEVFDTKAMKKMGMGAFLGVAQGSIEAPYLIKLSYNTHLKEDPVVLVGKGVTFDSGGLSLKSSKGMEEMKADMTGSAVVYASFLALAKAKINKPVVALLALVENMPSGTAQRPGDVVKTMDGTHVEVLNTDAEGRLILADTLCYAKTLKPKVIIDVATLTGAAVVALGTVATAAFTNRQTVLDDLLASSKKWGERIWQLPLYGVYKNFLNSDVADLKNVGGPYGGACTAAMFLKYFVGDSPWIHLDISPKMSAEKTKGADVKGMQAPCIRSIVEWVHTLS